MKSLIITYILLVTTYPAMAKNCSDISGKYYSHDRYETKTIEQQSCSIVRIKNCFAQACSHSDLVADGKWRANSKDGRVLNHHRSFFNQDAFVVQYRWGQINNPSIQGTTRYSLTKSLDLLIQGNEEDFNQQKNQNGQNSELWKRIGSILGWR
jgi:hypothetical protein